MSLSSFCKQKFALCALGLGVLVLNSHFLPIFAQDTSVIDPKLFIKNEYQKLRMALLEKGWQPVDHDASRPEYKEISCGTRGDCVGFWAKSQGREAFVEIDKLQKPHKVINFQFKQTVTPDNGGVLFGSYCIGTFSNIKKSPVSGDVSGFEIAVRGTEIEFVAAEGDLIGTKIKEFSVSGNDLEFTVWGKPFKAECSGKRLIRKQFNRVKKKMDSEIMERRSFLATHPNIVKWEDNKPDVDIAANSVTEAVTQHVDKGESKPNRQVTSPDIKVVVSAAQGSMSIKLQSRSDGILRVNKVIVNRGNCSVIDTVSFANNLTGGLVNLQSNGNLKGWLELQGCNTRSFNDPLKFGDEIVFYAACDVVEMIVETNFGVASFKWN